MLQYRHKTLSHTHDPFTDPEFREFPSSNSFRYRIPFMLYNPGSALTDYQLLFTVYRTNGASSGTTSYLGDAVKEDFSDLRFTSPDMVPLPYWIESFTTTSAKVWVKFPSIPAGNSIGYIYFGNPSASSASDGDATFLFFDDFSGSSIDSSKWTILSGNGNIYQSGGKLRMDYIGSQNNDWWSTVRQQKVLKLNSLPSGEFEAVVTLEPYTVNDRSYSGIAVYSTDTSAYTFGRTRWDSNWNHFQLAKLGFNNIANYASTSLPAVLTVRKTSTSYSFWIDVGSGRNKVGSDYSDLPFNALVLFGKEFGSSDINPVFDNFFIRKFVANEPSVSAWGDIQRV